MLELVDVGKRYGRTWALEDVTLALEPGDRIGLVGPNGAGKTTMLDLLAGLARPTRGTVRVEGRAAREDLVDLKSRVGYVGHHDGLYDALTVLENLRFAAQLHGLDRDAGASRCRDVAERLGVATRLHDRVGTLSRGLARRAALAAALVPAPDVLLLDEPFTGLDPQGREGLLDLLAEIDDGSRTLVGTAHRVDDVPRARRIVVLEDGRVRFDGPRDDAHKRLDAVYGGSS